MGQTSSGSAPGRKPLHGGPSQVRIEWFGGGFIEIEVASSAASLVQQFEAARKHSKSWVMEDVEHRVHVIEPGLVRYVRVAASSIGA